MKKTCIRNFSFLPSDYDCMLDYLNGMLKEGWRLKWVKAGFAGFEQTDPGEHIVYVIEPYANTSLISLRRLSRTWLNFYTGNEWYFAGKTRGNYIYFTRNEHPKPPSSTSSLAKNDSKERVITTEIKRNALILAAIGFLVYKLISSKAFMYAFVLTEFYQYAEIILLIIVLAAVAAILLYSLETVRLQNKSFIADAKTGLSFGRLYHVRNFTLILLIAVFFIMANRSEPKIIFYLLLPVAALIIGGLGISGIVHKNSEDENPGKKVMPMAYGVGALTLGLLLFSLMNIQNLQKAQAEINTAKVLTEAQSEAHIVYTEVFDGTFTPRAKKNSSYMGVNYLYEEADEAREHIVFTNYSAMKSRFAADRIFDYLYTQAENDYVGTFKVIETSGNIEGYVMETHNACLLRKGNTVVLTTINGDADSTSVNAAIEELMQNLS